MAGGIVFFVNQWICFVKNMKSNSRYDYLLRWSTKIVKPQWYAYPRTGVRMTDVMSKDDRRNE